MALRYTYAILWCVGHDVYNCYNNANFSNICLIFSVQRAEAITCLRPMVRSPRGNAVVTNFDTMLLLEQWQFLIAEFMKNLAAITHCPFCFVLWGNCKKGLMRHMSLSPLRFSDLLLALGFIEFKGDKIEFKCTCCKEYFCNSSVYGLLGPPDKQKN